MVSGPANNAPLPFPQLQNAIPPISNPPTTSEPRQAPASNPQPSTPPPPSTPGAQFSNGVDQAQFSQQALQSNGNQGGNTSQAAVQQNGVPQGTNPPGSPGVESQAVNPSSVNSAELNQNPPVNQTPPNNQQETPGFEASTSSPQQAAQPNQLPAQTPIQDLAPTTFTPTPPPGANVNLVG